MDDPTVIVKSLKDFNSFLNGGKIDKRKEAPFYIRQNVSGISNYSPRMKLEFDDTIGNDQSSNIDSFNLHNESYLQRHKDGIAGFDITKRIREKDLEINQRKTTIAVLESRLENCQSSNKKRKIDYESELENRRKSNFRDKELIFDLQHKLKQLQTLEKESKENTAKVQNSLKEKCDQLEKKCLMMRTQMIQQNDKQREEIRRLRDLNNNIEQELNERSSSMEILEVTNKQLEERSKRLSNKSVMYEKSNLDCEHLTIKLNQEVSKNKELEMRLQDLKDQEQQFELFKKSIRKIPLLEREIVKLKDENSTHKLMAVNVDLVKEKLTAAENEVRFLGNTCSELTAENGTLTMMTEMSEKYEVAVKQQFNLDYMPPVSEFVELIVELKKRDNEASTALLELKESLKCHDSYRTSSDQNVTSLKCDLNNSKQEVERLSTILKRLQRKLVLVSKERDSLKCIMNSYESESTINVGWLEKMKISGLESILEDYKSELAKYDSETDRLVNAPPRPKTSAEVTSSSEEMKENIKELQLKLESLSEEKEMLEMKVQQHVLGGSFDPSRNKVLQFLDNPLEKANKDSKAQYDCLFRENETLKKRIELMQKGEEDLTQKVGVAVHGTDLITRQQVQELKEKSSTQEVQIQRMLEAFKLKSKEMREIVHRLTGYRVDLRGDNSYKLINSYSDSSEDFLMFEEKSNGEMQLMETDFSLSLKSFIKLYLERGSSYPAFLSAITLKLYNRQSMIHSPESSSSDDDDQMDDDGLSDHLEDEDVNVHLEDEEANEHLEDEEANEHLEDDDDDEEEVNRREMNYSDDYDDEDDEVDMENDDDERDDSPEDDEELICLD